MNFAKLFTTPEGQFLLTTDDDHNGKPSLIARYHIKSPIEGADAVVTKSRAFEASDEGKEVRDKTFDDFDQEDAERLVADGF